MVVGDYEFLAIKKSSKWTVGQQAGFEAILETIVGQQDESIENGLVFGDVGVVAHFF